MSMKKTSYLSLLVLVVLVVLLSACANSPQPKPEVSISAGETVGEIELTFTSDARWQMMGVEQKKSSELDAKLVDGNSLKDVSLPVITSSKETMVVYAYPEPVEWQGEIYRAVKFVLNRDAESEAPYLLPTNKLEWLISPQNLDDDHLYLVKEKCLFKIMYAETLGVWVRDFGY